MKTLRQTLGDVVDTRIGVDAAPGIPACPTPRAEGQSFPGQGVRSVFTLGLAALLALLLTGCSSLGYYAQAVGGHIEVMQAKRPIRDVVEDATTDPGLRQKLQQVDSIREFASRELALPDNGSYRSYADLGRPFVVWNVFAAPEFSIEPEKWCMAVVGCVSYRGFYDRGEAERLANELRDQGFDTYVGGVPAYSTLGFFDDPVLNTFLRFGDIEVARLIFHELAHQVAFAEDDSAFNESFATAVENEGVRRWLAYRGTPELGSTFTAQQQRKTQFAELVARYRRRLDSAYAESAPIAAKRRAKAEVIGEMRREYATLKANWGGHAAYDAWLDKDLNNAKMATLALYTQLVPAFEAIFDEEGRDFARFYRRVATLARLPKTERRSELARAHSPVRQATLEHPPAVPVQVVVRSDIR